MAGLTVQLLRLEQFKVDSTIVALAEIKQGSIVLEVQRGMKQRYEIPLNARQVEIMPGVGVEFVSQDRRYRVSIRIHAKPEVQLHRMSKEEDTQRFLGGVHPKVAEI